MSRPYHRPLPSPPVITPLSRCAMGGRLRSLLNAGHASGVSPWSDAADFVIAYPFTIEVPTTVYKGFWLNGSAAGGNSDVAIYDEGYGFLVGCGSTGGVNNSVPQAAALTATTKLPPGIYYAGMSHSATTTNQLSRFSTATLGTAIWMGLGCWKFADGPPIAGNATPADLTNVAFPMFGLITRSGFDV